MEGLALTEEEKAQRPPDKLVFGIDIHTVEFSGKGALATYPVASPFTSARFPETYMRYCLMTRHLQFNLFSRLYLYITPKCVIQATDVT
jgi:hypothetical protein